MDHVDPHKSQNNETTRDESLVPCPKCTAQAHLYIDVLDSSQAKKYRVFTCECGEVIWVDE